jgi:hypothetical protein
MPMPYSHIVLAERIAKDASLPIVEKAQYYAGAFYPDIRYYTKQPREKYHFAVEKLESYEQTTEVSKDFSLGYKVHLLIDEVWEYPDLKVTYKEAFPSILRSRMTRGLQVLAFEMYCLEQSIETITLKPVENKLTRDLGVTTSEAEIAIISMQKYLDNPSLRAAYVMSDEAHLLPPERLKTVGRVVSLMGNPMTGALARFIVRRATRQLFPLMVSKVMERLEVNDPQQNILGYR